MNVSYTRSGLRQIQNDVFESITNQFVELWKRGHSASYNINCFNGEAWMNFSSYLGYQESYNQSHSENTKSKSAKRSKGSPSKQRRNQKRLEAFQEKKRLESSQQSQQQQSESPDETSEVTPNNIEENCLENPDNIPRFNIYLQKMIPSTRNLQQPQK